MAEEISEVELNKTGTKVQTITSVATAALGALLGGGVIAANVSNPILLGITIFSSLLPSLFHKKKPAAPAALGLMGDAVPANQLGGGGLSAVGAVLGQIVAILTAVLGWLHQMPAFVPAKWQPWIVLSAAAIAGFLPGLQKLGELLKGGAPS